MTDFQLAVVWRFLAYGLLASGAMKLLYILLAAGRFTPVQLQYQLITCVLFLGVGGTVLIRQSE